MWWASAIQTGLQLFGALGEKDSGREARAIANLNADAERRETEEEIRRMREQFTYTEGMTRSLSAGSGFSQAAGDSQDVYLKSMAQEHNRQINWARESGLKREEILRRGGDLAYRQASAGALQSLAGAAGSAADMISLGRKQNWKLWG